MHSTTVCNARQKLRCERKQIQNSKFEIRDDARQIQGWAKRGVVCAIYLRQRPSDVLSCYM